MPRSRLLPLLALAAAAGCTEDPSFRLRWQLGRTAESFTELTSVAQCTELGISRVRVTTETNAQPPKLVDEREFACFPGEFADPEFFAPGPEVGPGEYLVTVLAIGHRGVPYREPPVPEASTGDGTTGDAGETTGESTGSTGETTGETTGEPEPERPIIAFARQEVTVRETGENRRLPEFQIVGPAECDDGVDNDRDGAADLADPSCRGSEAGSEFGDLASAQITVRPRLMSGFRYVDCDGLDIATIRVDLAGPTPVERTFACTTVARTFSENLASGVYTLTVTALDADGEVQAIPTLDPTKTSFELFPSGYRVVDLEADFTIASLKQPVEDGFRFSLDYETGPDSLPAQSCTPVPPTPVLATVEVVLLDEAMAPFDATLYSSMGPIPIGSDAPPLMCEGKARYVEPFTWGPGGRQAVYVTAQAFASDPNTACWGTTDPVMTAPGADFAIPLQRLSTTGPCQ